MISDSIINPVISLLENAGREIMTIYREGNFRTRLKEDDSPVTRADLAADSIIKQGLASLTPGVPVFSEETKDIEYSTRAAWNPLWILDPLDGTKEFIGKNGEFCISLAFINNNIPRAGFIHAPVSKITWYAVKGLGAYRIDNGAVTRLPLNNPAGPIRINISRSHYSGKEASWIKKFSQDKETELEVTGSAIKFCRIAEGNSDIYPKFTLIHEWDVAAGHIIIEEAGGGFIETESGKAPVYNKEDYHQAPFIAFGQRGRKLLAID